MSKLPTLKIHSHSKKWYKIQLRIIREIFENNYVKLVILIWQSIFRYVRRLSPQRVVEFLLPSHYFDAGVQKTMKYPTPPWQDAI